MLVRARAAVGGAVRTAGARAREGRHTGSSAAVGWVLAITSAAAFGTSGALGTPLVRADWSPGAVVAVRVALGALLLVVPAVRALRGRWFLLRRNAGLICGYGLLAVAGCQLFYFNALETLSVGVALLLEYMGIVMVVIWLWLRHGHRPRALTIGGTVLAVAGLVLVLDLLGGNVHIDVAGVLWGLAAGVGLATYFVLSSRAGGGLPPLVLACGGLIVGALVLGLAGLMRVIPMAASTRAVSLAGYDVPWWVTILGLGLLAAAVSYATGIGAIRRLGSKLGAFVSLAEVLFAVIFAWLLLGQLPALVQLGGGVLIVGGVALVRLDELRGAAGVRAADRAPVTRTGPGSRAFSAGDTH